MSDSSESRGLAETGARLSHLPVIRDWIDARADEMACLLTRLVSIETENPPGRHLRECAAALSEAMDGLGLNSQVLLVDGAEESCIVRASAGTGERLVYFHGHFDVVPAQDRAQFTPIREDDRIVGRGTADMKGGIVSMIYAAAAAQELGLLAGGRVVLHLVCDEETGSTVGSGYLRMRELINPSALAMLTAEQSGEVVWHAAKGALSLRVEVRGRASHVGRADQGINAFLHMIEVARPLGEYARRVRAQPTSHPVGSGNPRGTMIAVGGESGSGASFNVVPGRSWFTIDGRFIPEQDVHAELARLTGLIEDAAAQAGADVEVAVTQLVPSAQTSSTGAPARLLSECVEAVSGRPTVFELSPGCLDTRWYAELGIPSFGYGPGTFEVSHGPHEWVSEQAMHRVSAAYAVFAAELCAGYGGDQAIVAGRAHPLPDLASQRHHLRAAASERSR